MDGHGGKEAAIKAKEILEPTFSKYWKLFHNPNSNPNPNPNPNNEELNLLDKLILHSTLCDMDIQMREFQYLGCTATLILIYSSIMVTTPTTTNHNSNNKIKIVKKVVGGNVGDSQCYLALQGGNFVTELTKEHKVNDKQERIRIENLGIHLESGADPNWRRDCNYPSTRRSLF